MPVQLHEPGWQVALMTAAYYHVLNEDDDFARALAALYHKFGRIRDRKPTARQRELMERFAVQWPLPRAYAISDLWFSVFESWEPRILKRPDPDPPLEEPTISLDIVIAARRPIWLSEERACLSVDLAARDLTLEGGGWSNISAPKPDPNQYFYDPSFMRRRDLNRWADDVAGRIRQSIVSQADEIDRKARMAGMRPLPPRLHNPHHLLLMAQRLYLRAVKRRSWAEIGRIAGPDRSAEASGIAPARMDGESSRQAVRKSVNAWASKIDVSLPPRTNTLV